MATQKKEVWLRGPLDDIPVLMQPVAHALLQAREELTDIMAGFPEILLTMRTAGLASPVFHLQHLTGVMNRLFTYARGESLSREQFEYLVSEGKDNGKTVDELVAQFSNEVDRSIQQMKQTDPATLGDVRGVGREQIPSTINGLYVHSAEHTTRHIGQLLVTARVLKEQYGY